MMPSKARQAVHARIHANQAPAGVPARQVRVRAPRSAHATISGDATTSPMGRTGSRIHRHAGPYYVRMRRVRHGGAVWHGRAGRDRQRRIHQHHARLGTRGDVRHLCCRTHQRGAHQPGRDARLRGVSRLLVGQSAALLRRAGRGRVLRRGAGVFPSPPCPTFRPRASSTR
jgi:hypothetical protein